MMAFARRQSLPILLEALETLDAKPKRDEAERMTRAVLMEIICDRSPAANAAFNAWAEGTSDANPVTVIVTAAREG
jgi:hypothetical protein